jgi:hypothetical protein
LRLATWSDVSGARTAATVTVCPERYALNIALRAMRLIDCPAWSPSWWMNRRKRFALLVTDVGMSMSIVPVNWFSSATHCSNGTACGTGSAPGAFGFVIGVRRPGRLMKSWLPVLAGHSSASASAR